MDAIEDYGIKADTRHSSRAVQTILSEMSLSNVQGLTAAFHGGELPTMSVAQMRLTSARLVQDMARAGAFTMPAPADIFASALERAIASEQDHLTLYPHDETVIYATAHEEDEDAPESPAVAAGDTETSSAPKRRGRKNTGAYDKVVAFMTQHPNMLPKEAKVAIAEQYGINEGTAMVYVYKWLKTQK